MAIPRVFAPVNSGDFTLTPITVHKEFVISGAAFLTSGSGYMRLEAQYRKDPARIGASGFNEPTNSIDGSYQSVVWKSIDHMYYRNPYDSYATFEHANKRYTYKYLHYSASVFSFPQLDFGESIKPGSFQMSSSGDDSMRIFDDGNGNIYDPSLLNFGVELTPKYNMIGYWSFKGEFRQFQDGRGGFIPDGKMKYESRTFEPDDQCELHNIGISPDAGISIFSVGMCSRYYGNSYILTNNRIDFNPDKTEKFSIFMVVNIPPSQSVTTSIYNTILSKRGTIRKNVYGLNETYNSNGVLNTVKHISSSVYDILTDIYPYDIEYINSTAGIAGAKKIRARRSDGYRIIEVTSSALLGDNHMIGLAIDTGSFTLYVDTDRYTKTHPILENINNEHCLMFGALDRTGRQGLSGSISEIRFYNEIFSTSQIDTHNYSGNIFQTAIIGNIFYRQGIVVFTTPNLAFSLPNMLSSTYGCNNNYVVKYKSTHTIYQYEVLCRVKKGSFNLTYNPTARKSFKSDLLINDMTGSLLMPYATTIGLYNDRGDLVAVGKLGQAVQMRDDVDINFLVRWDA